MLISVQLLIAYAICHRLRNCTTIIAARYTKWNRLRRKSDVSSSSNCSTENPTVFPIALRKVIIRLKQQYTIINNKLIFTHAADLAPISCPKKIKGENRKLRSYVHSTDSSGLLGTFKSTSFTCNIYRLLMCIVMVSKRLARHARPERLKRNRKREISSELYGPRTQRLPDRVTDNLISPTYIYDFLELSYWHVNCRL